MREEIYRWMYSLAVFYILLTMALHLVPDRGYVRYVRFFMGLLLILMVITPVTLVFGKSGELMEAFQGYFQQENLAKEQQEILRLQEICLQKGYEEELAGRITEALREAGIQPVRVEVQIRDSRASAVVYLSGKPDEEQERRIRNELMESCHMGEGEYQIKAVTDGE